MDTPTDKRWAKRIAVVTVAIMLLSTYVYARSVLMWLATPVNTGTKSAS